jgi:hypothetical protein
MWLRNLREAAVCSQRNTIMRQLQVCIKERKPVFDQMLEMSTGLDEDDKEVVVQFVNAMNAKGENFTADSYLWC